MHPMRKASKRDVAPSVTGNKTLLAFTLPEESKAVLGNQNQISFSSD
jgi:hypothetical protein